VVAPESRDAGVRYFFAISFIMSAISSILIPVMPIYAGDIGATPFVLGLIGSVPAVTYAAFTILLGGLWDRLAKKTPIIAFYLLYASVCLLFSFTVAPLQIVILKVLEGFSWSLFWPPVEILIAERTTASDKMVSNFGISWSSGGALGVFLSGFALELNRPKDIFRLVSFSSLVLALTSFLLVKERRIEKVELGKRKKANPGMTKILLMHKEAWLAAVIYSFGQNIVFALFPDYAYKIKSIPGLMIGLYISLLIAGRTLAFWIFGKIHIKNISSIGAALVSLGSLPMAFTTSVPMLAVGFFSLGLGAGFLYSDSFKKAMTADADKRGLYAGIFEGSIGVGSLSPVVAGALAEQFLNGPYILSSVGTASAFLWFTLHPSQEKNR